MSDTAVTSELVWRDLEGLKWDAEHFISSAFGRHAGYTLSRGRNGSVRVSVTPTGANTPGNLRMDEECESEEAAKAECESYEKWLNGLNVAQAQ